MLDFFFNIAQSFHNINWWQIATPIITAVSSFGAVYFGAWLTDKRREEEQQKLNLNKLVILHTLVELQIPALMDYRDKILIPKLKAINSNDLRIATEKYSFASWLLSINIVDYSFLINTNKGALSVLNQVMKYQEELDSVILAFNNFTLTDEEKRAVNSVEIHIVKIKSVIETLYDTCDNLIYFSLLLHRCLTYILGEVHKEKITCSDRLMEVNLTLEAKNNIIKLGWLKILPKGWEKPRFYQEQNKDI